MIDGIEKMLEVLLEEKCLYKNILELSVQETDVLINNNIKELDMIVEKEQFLIIKLGETECKRQNILVEIAEQMNIEEQLLTANKILEKASPEMKDQISSVVDELTTILDKQKELNETNMHLIENNLSYINEMIHQVIIGDVKKNNYNGSGNRSLKQKQNIIDQSV